LHLQWPMDLCQVLTSYLVDEMIIKVGGYCDIAIHHSHFHPLPWQVEDAVTVTQLIPSSAPPPPTSSSLPLAGAAPLSTPSPSVSSSSSASSRSEIPSHRWYGGKIKKICNDVITVSVVADAQFVKWCNCPIDACKAPTVHVCLIGYTALLLLLLPL
jgi:hypothetical protein